MLSKGLSSSSCVAALEDRICPRASPPFNFTGKAAMLLYSRIPGIRSGLQERSWLASRWFGLAGARMNKTDLRFSSIKCSYSCTQQTMAVTASVAARNACNAHDNCRPYIFFPRCYCPHMAGALGVLVRPSCK